MHGPHLACRAFHGNARNRYGMIAQLHVSGAPGATNWHVLPLLPNIRLPASRVYRMPSLPQHPVGSQLATWGFVCATATDALAARRTANTQITDFIIICSLVGI